MQLQIESTEITLPERAHIVSALLVDLSGPSGTAAPTMQFHSATDSAGVIEDWSLTTDQANKWKAEILAKVKAGKYRKLR